MYGMMEYLLRTDLRRSASAARFSFFFFVKWTFGIRSGGGRGDDSLALSVSQ